MSSMTAGVTRPPLLRMTTASPRPSPRVIAGSTRWSRQVTMTTCAAGGPGGPAGGVRADLSLAPRKAGIFVTNRAPGGPPGPARARGSSGSPAAARRGLRAIGRASLEFARQEPGLFATAFALPHQHAYDAPGGRTGQDPLPLDQLRAVLDELADAGVLSRQPRAGLEDPRSATVHGRALLDAPGPPHH